MEQDGLQAPAFVAKFLLQYSLDGRALHGAGVEGFPRWFWENSFWVGLAVIAVVFYILGKKEGEW